LEFDTVIIPSLDRSTSGEDKQLLLWQERINQQSEKQLLLSSIAATGNEEDKTYKFMRAQSDKQNRLESTRLLYVACTRAIKQLHLLACLGMKKVETKKEILSDPAKNSMLASIWQYIKDNAHLIDANYLAKLDAQDENKSIENHHIIIRLHSQWQFPELTNVNLLKNYRGHEFNSATDENPLNLPEHDNENSRRSRHLGTLIHRILQSIVENRLITHQQSLDSDEYVKTQLPFWQNALHNLGIYHSAANIGLEKVTQAITKTLNNPEGIWLLNSEHQASACELSLIYQLSEKNILEENSDSSSSAYAIPKREDIKTAIIDRTFIDKDIRWIIDYKSSEPHEGQELADFFAAEIEKHTPQLHHYKTLMEKLDSHRVCCGIYFTCVGKLQILTDY
jgi:ATP-dependent helicase/nuclease subunit A